MTKPRKQRAPNGATKAQILAYLEDRPRGERTGPIAKLLGMDLRTVRQHLYQLETLGKVKGLADSEGKSNRVAYAMVWCLPKFEATAMPAKPATRAASAGREQSPPPVVAQIIRPAGTWRLDHPTAARSVFEMGAA